MFARRENPCLAPSRTSTYAFCRVRIDTGGHGVPGMKVETYKQLKQEIIAYGHERDVIWAETVAECESADDFAREHAFVVCNSGMRAQTARKVFEQVWGALTSGNDPARVFGHEGKVGAIVEVYNSRERIFAEYLTAGDKLAFLETLPWIGPITKYHLAKNFGVDCCKPDRHLVRIADSYGTTPEAMCRQLSQETGDRIGTVDYVIWQAANLRLI